MSIAKFTLKRLYTDNKLIYHKKNKIKIMGNILYAVAVILVIAWAIGFLGYHVGALIHILLVIAVIAIILRVIQGKSIV